MISYFLENLWQAWLILAVLCLILELTNGDFFICCFAIGAAVTTIAAAIGFGFYAQLAVFAVASVLCLFFVRPVALKYLNSGHSRASNAEALIGRTGRVSQDIPADGYGRVAIDGDDWKACAADGQAIPQGSTVTVVSLDSIILTVKPQ